MGYMDAHELDDQQIHVIRDLETVRLISDPLRLQILEALRKEPRTVKQVAAQLDVPATNLYYHVRLLEQRGLIRVTDTRIVSGIIEKRYQTVAYRLSIDRRLLEGAPAD